MGSKGSVMTISGGTFEGGSGTSGAAGGTGIQSFGTFSISGGTFQGGMSSYGVSGAAFFDQTGNQTGSISGGSFTGLFSVISGFGPILDEHFGWDLFRYDVGDSSGSFDFELFWERPDLVRPYLL